MSETSPEKAPAEIMVHAARGAGRPEIWLAGLGGFVAGLIVCGMLVLATMPALIIETKECRQGVDETLALLELRIAAAEGWQISGAVHRLDQTLTQRGAPFSQPVAQLTLCHPQHAAAVLENNRELASIMPCTFAVWQGDDGKTYLSRLNTGFLARFFSGPTADILAGRVAADEARILSGLLVD